MLSSCQRFYRIIQFQMFTIFVVMLLTPYVTAWEDHTPQLGLTEISISKTRIRPTDQTSLEHDEADLSFHVSYNISNSMKWTTKEIYLGLIAVWTDETGLQEQVVWDKTIFHTDLASFAFDERIAAKYTLRSYNGVKLPGCSVAFRYVLYEVGFGGRFRKTYYDVADAQIAIPSE